MQPQICHGLAMSNSISHTMRTWGRQFDKIYAKRAFVHWFSGEGLSEGYFGESRENLEAYGQDYLEVFMGTIESGSDDEEESMY